jgi:hypothetical protein
VTPRIVRAQRNPSVEASEFWYGNEAGTRNAPLGGVTIEGLGSTGFRSPTIGGVPGAPAPTASPSADAAVSGNQGAVTWDLPAEVKSAEEFDATLNLDTGDGASVIRAQIRYDINALELVSAAAGAVVGSAETKVETPNGMVSLESKAASGVISGSGALMKLHFRALGARPMTSISGRVVMVSGAGGPMNPTAPPAATMTIRP